MDSDPLNPKTPDGESNMMQMVLVVIGVVVILVLVYMWYSSQKTEGVAPYELTPGRLQQRAYGLAKPWKSTVGAQ